MRIQAKFFIVLLLSVATVAVLGFLLYASSLTIRASWMRMANAEEIVKKTGDFRFFTLEYVLFPQSRTEVQWGLSLDALQKQMSRFEIDDVRERQKIETIERGLRNAQMLFGKIKTQNDRQILSPLKERLVSQLSITMQEIISDAFVLSDMNRVRIESLQQRSERLVVFVGGGVVLLMFFVCFTIIWGIIKKLNIVLEKLPVGVAVVDSKSGKATLINSWGRKLLGNEFIKGPIAKTLKKGETVTQDDMVITHPDGKNIQMRATSTAVKDAGGKVLCAVAVFEDITKEKQIDKAKTEFVSLASHQLRTPLATINWYSEMLLSEDAGKINDAQKEYLQEIYQSSQRLVKLANALLDVSRINLGTFVVEPEMTDLTALLKSVIDEQKPQINVKKLALITNFGNEVPKLKADPKLLRMIFQNLLSNAVKYTPVHGKIIMSSTLQQDKKTIQVSVADTGFGIPKKEQEKIFTKLFRATNARQHEPDGTGLGLYIVKSMVEHSSGKIWFVSEENKGTTFYVTFPIFY